MIVLLKKGGHYYFTVNVGFTENQCLNTVMC